VILQILYSALWTGLAVLNGMLAEEKGERGYKWFLLSLPLGPLASVLIMARPAVQPRADLPMLNDDELLRVAEAYARQQYGEVHGDDYTLVKAADIVEPPGAHFYAQYPPAVHLTGDGGFFVARADGHVTPLGAGELMRAAWELGSPPASVSRVEIVRRVMLARRRG
jgi:hypothetical protein